MTAAKPPDLGPRYRWIQELGQGGVGRVHLVEDRYRGERLALKLLLGLPAAPDLEAFRKEFALLAEIEHPGVARAHDFGFLGEVPYYTSEYIRGLPLGATGGAAEVLRRILEVVDAVAFLHRSAILHLDIKPGNILVPEDSPGRARLIDFGLFRRGLGAAPRDRIRGSLPYMAPERFRGGEIGPWTDVYALGVTFYRALTGCYPRPALTTAAACLEDGAWIPSPPPPSASSRAVPERLDPLLLRCLALDPASRFPSAAELGAALRSIGLPEPRAAAAHPASRGTVGRERELEVLDGYVSGLLGEGPASSRTAEGPLALLITGPPGIGQSHLLRAMAIRAQTRGVPFYLECGYPGRGAAPGSLFRCLLPQLPDPWEHERWHSFLARLRRPRSSSRNEVSEEERRLRRAGELAVALRAARKPFVLAVDGLQFFDEISITLLLDLLRLLGADGAGRPPAVGLILGYREEGLAVPLLRELTDEIERPGRGITVTLGPLSMEETWKLYRQHAAPDVARSRSFEVFQATGGVPSRAVVLASGKGAASVQRPAGAAGQAGGRQIEMAAAERRLLLLLVHLGRPAPASEAARLLGAGRRRTGGVLERLRKGGFLAETEIAPGEPGWLAEPVVKEWALALGSEARRRLHGLLASSLLERASGEDDPLLIEVADHFRLAGQKAAAFRYGLLAARYLKSTFQNQAALERYQTALGALPAGSAERRFEVLRQVIELKLRTGDLEGGIELLREVLEGGKKLSGRSRRTALLWLATLHARHGDCKRASALFEVGFRGGSGGRLTPEERLFFLNEHASLKTFTGDREGALRLCEEGLRLAGPARSFPLREMALNLLATRANVRLRGFEHEEAVRDFEKSLEIAEAAGSPANQAVILNNLGIVHAGCDRYEEAIKAYRRAEKLSRRLDEGPSLLSIHANLAILCAKTGDFRAVEEELSAAATLSLSSMGRKLRLFLEHARGLSRTYQGRYGEAEPCLRRAIELAKEVSDPFIAAFDEVYLAEVLLFQGRYAEARGPLAAQARGSGPPCLRKMAWSRLALLHAFLDHAEEARRAAREHAAVEDPRPVPYLEAWDRLYLAWAASSLGEREVSRRALEPGNGRAGAVEDQLPERLEACRKFFAGRGAWPAAAMARWVLAEHLFLRSDPAGARQAMAGRPISGNDLTAALDPLLAARLLPEGGPEGWTRDCADLLSRAGERLSLNPLPEWDLRLRALQARLRGREDDLSRIEAQRRELAKGLPSEERRASPGGSSWARWVSEFPAAGPAPAAADEGGGEETRLMSETAPSADGKGRTTRRALVTRSGAMKALLAVLDRIKKTDLPVLIRGETGTGKELIARVIHEESRRRRNAFVVVDGSTIPEPLLEVELFGARAGAFTDLKEDRPGLLLSAQGGTVFLDEVGGLSSEVQKRLLRVLASRRLRRLGDEREVPLEARFIFSTAEDFEAAARQGRLRADFFHRLQGIPVRVPPLRERREDLPDLVAALLREAGRPPGAIRKEALDRLAEHSWPGNLRELRNLVTALALENSGSIPPEEVSKRLAAAEEDTVFPRHLLGSRGLADLRERLDRDYIVFHLRRLGGNTLDLSRHLGISRLQLYRRCHRLGIRLRKRKGK